MSGIHRRNPRIYRRSKDAQNMLLTYLDRMKPGHAFPGTTNLDIGNLTERFQTRFQPVRLQPPGKRGSRGIPRPALGRSHLYHLPDRGRGQGQCHDGDAGFGGVDGVMHQYCF